MTVHVPLTRAAGQLRPTASTGSCPRCAHELVTALMRSLPKELRRAARARARTSPRRCSRALAAARGPLLDALARELEAPARRARPAATRGTSTRCPPHLRMTLPGRGRATAPSLAEGHDLDALRERAAPAAARRAGGRRRRRSSATGCAPGRSATLPRDGRAAGHRAAPSARYPALVDEGDDGRRARARDRRRRRRAAMRARHAAAAAAHASPRRRAACAGRLGDGAAARARRRAARQRWRAVARGRGRAALDALIAEAGGPAWDEAGFARLRDHVAGALAEPTPADRRAGRRAVLDAAREVRAARWSALAAAGAAARARATSRAQLAPARPPRLRRPRPAPRACPTSSATCAPPRARLERLPDALAADRDRMRVVHELEDAYARRAWRRWPAGARSRRRCGRCPGCSRSCARAGRRPPSGSAGRWRRPARDADRARSSGIGRATNRRRRRR